MESMDEDAGPRGHMPLTEMEVVDSMVVRLPPEQSESGFAGTEEPQPHGVCLKPLTLSTSRSRRSTAGNRMQAAFAEMRREEATRATSLPELEDDEDFAVRGDKDEQEDFESDFASTEDEAEEDSTTGGKEVVEAVAQADRSQGPADALWQPAAFNLSTNRARRSTAGNRMQAALAEMAVEATAAELDDDGDFALDDKDEVEQFESDFASTDEEAEEQQAAVSEVVAERAVQDEEKRERQAARSRLEKATALAHARNRATFNPNLSRLADEDEDDAPVASSSRLSAQPQSKAKRTVAFLEDEDGSGGKRKSLRMSTVQSSTATGKRLRDAEQKAVVPRKRRARTQTLTQAELIARALDNEEGNIAEHKNYLRDEERKRKRARVVKAKIKGPVLRWISRLEEEEFPTDSLEALISPFTGLPHSQTSPAAPPPPTLLESPPPPPPPPPKQTETVAKNYLVHDTGLRTGSTPAQICKSSKPPWAASMSTLFGDHVKWDEVRVYCAGGRGVNGRTTRPVARPTEVCAVTGRVARYLDPLTGTPFADGEAFRRVRRVLAHEYVWDEGEGCFDE